MAAAEGWVPKTCQYIEGEAINRNFCGKPVKKNYSYCDHHHDICYDGFARDVLKRKRNK